MPQDEGGEIIGALSSTNRHELTDSSSEQELGMAAATIAADLIATASFWRPVGVPVSRLVCDSHLGPRNGISRPSVDGPRAAACGILWPGTAPDLIQMMN